MRVVEITGATLTACLRGVVAVNMMGQLHFGSYHGTPSVSTDVGGAGRSPPASASFRLESPPVCCVGCFT